MINRLGELASASVSETTGPSTNLKTPLLDKNDMKADIEVTVRNDPEISAFLRPYEPIKVQMEKIRSNTDAIVGLNEREGKATDAERRGIMSELDVIMTQTTSIAKGIKQQLSVIKQQNEDYEKKNPNSAAKTRIRQGILETHTRRFRQDMNEYNQMSFEFKQSLQTRTRRQLKILDADNKLSDEAIDKLVEEGSADQVIKKLSGGDATDVLRDIELRHTEIQRLEQQVLEVYELFKDLALLVDTQQESLDIIEKRVGSAKEHVIVAESELEIAEDYQRSSRKKQCCLLVILVVVLAVIAVVLSQVIPTG